MSQPEKNENPVSYRIISKQIKERGVAQTDEKLFAKVAIGFRIDTVRSEMNLNNLAVEQIANILAQKSNSGEKVKIEFL